MSDKLVAEGARSKSEKHALHQFYNNGARLFLTECAFLLWKVRCKRLFDDNEEARNKTPAPQEMYKKPYDHHFQRESRARPHPHQLEKVPKQSSTR